MMLSPRTLNMSNFDHQAILFAIIHLLSNFGLVIMDTGFFTKAFSASPAAVVPGYIVGGIAYFAIPWCLGTIMSLTAVSLETISPRFPTYPNRMVRLFLNLLEIRRPVHAAGKMSAS